VANASLLYRELLDASLFKNLLRQAELDSASHKEQFLFVSLIVYVLKTNFFMFLIRISEHFSIQNSFRISLEVTVCKIKSELEFETYFPTYKNTNIPKYESTSNPLKNLKRQRF
jgi:hypothetical protein